MRRSAILAGAILAWVMLALGALEARAADGALRLPSIPVKLDVEGRPLAVTVSGTVSPTPAAQGGETLRARLEADLSDLQRNLTDILRAHLNRDEKCGDRIAVQNATLVPAAPAATLTANLHVEKWACAKALGKEVAKRLTGGDAAVIVRLTPALEDAGAVRLDADVVSMDASGPLGDLLRSGPLGDALREKIRHSLVSSLRKVADFKASLPPAVQQIAAIRGAEFRDGGSGALVLAVSSEVHVTEERARSLLDRVKAEAK